MYALVLNIFSQCAHYSTKEQFINHRLASFSALCTGSISIWVSVSERPIIADNSNSPVYVNVGVSQKMHRLSCVHENGSPMLNTQLSKGHASC